MMTAFWGQVVVVVVEGETEDILDVNGSICLHIICVR